MAQTACIDIQALPLQLLLREHEAWHGEPVVVVDRDAPQGRILWANRRAYVLRIVPGMRYAAGLALSNDLRGGCVAHATVQATVDDITQRLWCFSPSIEPAPEEPGVFWLDASGLGNVYPSLHTWADAMRDELRHEQLQSVVAVGFSRFGSYAAAKASDANVLFASPEEEQHHVRAIPLERLNLAPTLRDTLHKLGVITVGQFIDLPAPSIRTRFGADAAALHDLARGTKWAPLMPQKLLEPIQQTASFDWPETNAERIVVRLARMVRDALSDLAERHQTLKALEMALILDNDQHLCERVAPATPTHDAQQILLLVRLRVESLTLSAGVAELRLEVEGVPTVHGQLELFCESGQHFDEAAQAFAAIRAEFGNDAVMCAEVQPGHLPEAQYHWKPVKTLTPPHPVAAASPGVMRRICTPALELPPCDRREPDGWLIAGIQEGPVEEVLGPYHVSGGWWARDTSRAYHYVRTRSGRWFWIYYDDVRRRWYLHGEAQ
jgi:protein ImuB